MFIVYCHPSEDSFTKAMCDAFIEGVTDSGNEYILSDLYKMNFKSDMTEEEYLRDAYYKTAPSVAADVLAEQKKINSSDAIVFIYPVFWTEAPAKLVGWFDRVWSYGFAYGEKTIKMLDKALILCSAGNSSETLEQFGLLDSMKKVMLGDRLFGRARESEFKMRIGKRTGIKTFKKHMRKGQPCFYNSKILFRLFKNTVFPVDRCVYRAI